MKKILLISILLFSLSLSAQDKKKDEYKDYTVCKECFQDEKWKKTGLDNYGIVSPNKPKRRKNGFLANTGRTIVYGVSAIVVGAITLVIYNSVSNATNSITR
jgi:hypothetical protein